MLAFLGVLSISAPAQAQDFAPRNDVDALAYTVVRTPPDLQIDVPRLDRDRNVLVGRVQPFPDRPVPDVFWYDRSGMEYGLVYQSEEAPLVFLIAGTGGSFNTANNRVLARVLYKAGFHVLGFPSPTHPNFLINASETGIAGRMQDDARDLYRVMQMAYAQVADRIAVTDVYLTGYSLGGTHAAWVAKLDEERREIGFDGTVILNPSVSLYNSVRTLDAMFDRHVPADPLKARAFLEGIFARFAEVYARTDDINLDGEFLYQAYQRFQPGVDALETLIGASFRYSLVNLAFTSDAMSRGGYMVPPDAELEPDTSLTNFFKHATRRTFTDFLDRLYLPYFQARNPDLTREQAIFEAGLLPLEDWLESADDVTLITNRDDIILNDSELAWLARTFGERATIFEDGGHCGNYLRADFAAALERQLQ